MDDTKVLYGEYTPLRKNAFRKGTRYTFVGWTATRIINGKQETLYNNGWYTEEEAKNSRDVHVITSFIGVDSREVGLKALSYKPIKTADITVLICSDGLTDMCTNDEIKEILSQECDNHAQLLVDKALENGGEDNVTCIVIKI